jgi:hypothetical protein
VTFSAGPSIARGGIDGRCASNGVDASEVNRGQLLRKQADIKGMAHPPGTGNGVVQFQVLVIVPGKGAYAVSWFYTKLCQRFGQAFDTAV